MAINKKEKIPPELFKSVEWLIRYYCHSRSFPESRDFSSVFERIVKASIAETCSDVPDENARKIIQGKVLSSATGRVPYRYLGECYCGENRFYCYRRDFYLRVAKRLGII